MNKKTVLISLVLALVFVFTVVNADTPGIKDIDQSSSYARGAILALAEKDIVKGDDLGNFEPTKAISRAEFVTMLDRVLQLDTTDVPAIATFKDVPTTNWAFKYVEAAHKAGIVNGVSPTEFGINDVSTREQMAAMFVRALKLVDPSEQIQLLKIGALSDKNKISSWAQKDVDIAMTAGLMNGVSTTSFGPQENATKEQTAVVIDRFMGKEDTIKENVKTAYGLNIEIKYPELYNALKTAIGENYVGNMEATMDMQLTDLDTKDYMKSHSQISGAANNEAMKIDTNTRIETNTDDPMEFTTKEIMTADKVYELDTDGKWIEYDRSEWENTNGATDLSIGGIDSTGMITKEFLDSYSKLPIQDVGTADINGTTAEKFVLSLDSASMKNLLSDAQYNEIKDMLGDSYQGTEKYNIEFYVAGGHIVREVVAFEGTAADSQTGMNIEVKTTIDASYSNIGVNTEIQLPNAADIKQPQE